MEVLNNINIYVVQDNDIEILINTTVNKIDTHEHKVFFEGKDGPQVEYDKLFLAVGMKYELY